MDTNTSEFQDSIILRTPKEVYERFVEFGDLFIRDTKGSELVRYHFNPSGLEDITLIKEVAALLINMIDGAEGDSREKAIAITHIQTASMFAVAAITKDK